MLFDKKETRTMGVGGLKGQRQDNGPGYPIIARLRRSSYLFTPAARRYIFFHCPLLPPPAHIFKSPAILSLIDIIELGRTEHDLK